MLTPEPASTERLVPCSCQCQSAAALAPSTSIEQVRTAQKLRFRDVETPFAASISAVGSKNFDCAQKLESRRIPGFRDWK